MPIPMHRLISVPVSVAYCAWLGVQVLGCARGDIVLGTGDDPLAHLAGPNVPLDDAVETAGASAPAALPFAAASGGVNQAPTPTPASAGGSMRGPASVPASTAPPVRPSVRDADAGPARPDVRRSNGCGTEPTQLTPIIVDGQPVSFELDVPGTYDKTRPYPLVLAFRSVETSADDFRSQLNLTTIADAIIAYPSPLDIGMPLQRDVARADELLSQLSAGYCVDLDHVFALGDGSGALSANLLGCVRGDQIRAIATFSNAPPPFGPCVGDTAVWLLQRNDIDPMTVGSGLGNRDFWAHSNACDPRMPKPVSPTPCVEYQGCSPGLPVRFCEYSGARWPSYAVSGAWEFFESF